jgi:hypothetical protein
MMLAGSGIWIVVCVTHERKHTFPLPALTAGQAFVPQRQTEPSSTSPKTCLFDLLCWIPRRALDILGH